LREGALVEPRGDSAGGAALRVADEVRPVSPEGVEEAADVSRRDRDRESLLERGDAVHLPAANNYICRFVEAAAVTLAAPEGQVIDKTGHQTMINVEVRPPAITLRVVIVQEALPAVELLPADARGCGLGVETPGPGVNHRRGHRGCAALELDVHRVVDRIARPVAVNEDSEVGKR